MCVLGIVTARGGSKGIPWKNFAALLGKPLLAYTAETALAAKRLTRTILPTEDEEIARVGREYGPDVPFIRPPDLAWDETPTSRCRRMWSASRRLRAKCAFLGVPAVNISSRQLGHEREHNVIDTDNDRKQIAEANERQVSSGRCPSDPIYGDGRAGDKGYTPSGHTAPAC